MIACISTVVRRRTYDNTAQCRVVVEDHPMSINRLFLRLGEAQEAVALGERAFNEVVRPHLTITTIGPQTKLVYVAELQGVAEKLHRGELEIPKFTAPHKPALPMGAPKEMSIEALRDRAKERLKLAA